MLKHLKYKIEMPLVVLAAILIVSIVIFSVHFSDNTGQKTSGGALLERVATLEENMNRSDAFRNQATDTNQGMQFRFNRLEGSLKLKTELLAERIDTLQASVKTLEAKLLAFEKTEPVSEKKPVIKPTGTSENKTLQADKKVSQPDDDKLKSQKIKNTVKPSENKFVHIIKRGETYFSISRKYDITVRQLLTANNKTKDAVIYPGQKLRIPEK